MKPRDIYHQVAARWDDTDWWRHVALPYALRRALLQPYFAYSSDDDGVNIMAEDWDTLIILDGCRYDTFEALYDGPGDLGKARSRGSNTVDFLERNFVGNRFYDTVYVTANPQVSVHASECFHDVIEVWRDAWDEELQTVLPMGMVEATIDAAERYPEKRLIAHFVQPHYPFIGDYGQAEFGEQAGIELSKRMANEEVAASDHDHVWLKLRKGAVEEDVVRRAYRENTKLVLSHIAELLSTLDGRTVVTSDHGNLFGERVSPFSIDVYGHPPGVYAEELIGVPWLVVENGQRKRWVAEAPTTERDVAGEVASDRLRQLGYLDA